jgi:hypothetical protein
MSEGIIKNITTWCKYIAAVADWGADCFISFPRKEKFFQNGQANTKNPD